ncbi:hypothetical protein C8J55DRAFT_557736 [Lentinula edodes]|uniref:Uncharacterized protein n=1 Tax=Lentinula lateritia TaxID=40482 RepID=A0A9W9DXE4_9AGAR|nr:hypothetical protein C8J55DRAFT_557736 [Lentinula edodes]
MDDRIFDAGPIGGAELEIHDSAVTELHTMKLPWMLQSIRYPFETLQALNTLRDVDSELGLNLDYSLAGEAQLMLAAFIGFIDTQLLHAEYSASKDRHIYISDWQMKNIFGNPKGRFNLIVDWDLRLLFCTTFPNHVERAHTGPSVHDAGSRGAWEKPWEESRSWMIVVLELKVLPFVGILGNPSANARNSFLGLTGITSRR